MTDKEKLLALYKSIKDIEMPIFESEKLTVLVNTIEAGIKIILDWLKDAANKYFNN